MSKLITAQALHDHLKESGTGEAKLKVVCGVIESGGSAKDAVAALTNAFGADHGTVIKATALTAELPTPQPQAAPVAGTVTDVTITGPSPEQRAQQGLGTGKYEGKKK